MPGRERAGDGSPAAHRGTKSRICPLFGQKASEAAMGGSRPPEGTLLPAESRGAARREPPGKIEVLPGRTSCLEDGEMRGR